MCFGILTEEVRQALHRRRRLNSQTELDTNIDITRLLDDLGELHRLVGGLLQVVDGEDLETRVADLGNVSILSSGFIAAETYQFVCLLVVGTLQSSNDRNTEVHALHNLDQTLGDGVAADNTTEDVDEDGSDLWIAGDQVESRANRFR